MTEEKKSTYKGYSQAQNKATQKYHREHLEQITIKVKKGTKAHYIAAAEKAGMPFSKFVLQSMDEKIERDLLD